MISSMIAAGLSSGAKNTSPSFLTAPIRVPIGVVTITAPMVPANTIIAAVTWATSLTLPPSITRPPRMPPIARIRPPMVARSGLLPDFFLAASAIDLAWRLNLGFVMFGVEMLQRARRRAGKNRPAKLDHSLYHLFSRFPHHDFLAGGQGHYSVGCHLHVFNEIRVQNQRSVIKACELDHGRLPS